MGTDDFALMDVHVTANGFGHSQLAHMLTCLNSKSEAQ